MEAFQHGKNTESLSGGAGMINVSGTRAGERVSSSLRRFTPDSSVKVEYCGTSCDDVTPGLLHVMTSPPSGRRRERNGTQT